MTAHCAPKWAQNWMPKATNPIEKRGNHQLEPFHRHILKRYFLRPLKTNRMNHVGRVMNQRMWVRTFGIRKISCTQAIQRNVALAPSPRRIERLSNARFVRIAQKSPSAVWLVCRRTFYWSANCRMSWIAERIKIWPINFAVCATKKSRYLSVPRTLLSIVYSSYFFPLVGGRSLWNLSHQSMRNLQGSTFETTNYIAA